MADRGKDLSAYRLKQAEDTLKIAEYSLKEHIYKDAVNRSYYVAFYAIKAVLALGTVDFRRHKDVMAYFNKEYVAAGIFPKALCKDFEKKVIMMIFILLQKKKQKSRSLSQKSFYRQ